MRHLSVPRAQTQRWLELCRTNQWFFIGAQIMNLEDGRNAIPLNDSAPSGSDAIWEDNPHLELLGNIQSKPAPAHWRNHLDEEFFAEFI